MQTIHFNHHHSFGSLYTGENLFGFRIFAYIHLNSILCVCLTMSLQDTHKENAWTFIHFDYKCLQLCVDCLYGTGGVGKWALIGQFTTHWSYVLCASLIHAHTHTHTHTTQKEAFLALSLSTFVCWTNCKACVHIYVCNISRFMYRCNCVWKKAFCNKREVYPRVCVVIRGDTGVRKTEPHLRWWWVWKWLKDGN